MSEIKAAQLDAALASGLAGAAIILVHGPDAGHVSEVAKRVAAATKVALDDAFSCLRGEADDYLSEGRLLDEARAISMFGGERLIWLKLGQRNAVNAVTALLEEAKLEARIILEAGDLKSGHALRTLCEKARNALSIVCYADESDSVQRLAAEMIAAAGKSIPRDAMSLLTESLGADRALTRGEIAKLLLYLGETAEIRVEDVSAIIAEANRVEPSAAIDAAFNGDIIDIEPAVRRVVEDGMDAGALLGLAFRHVQTLLSLIDQRRSGLELRDAVRRHGVHFRREAHVSKQLSLWNEERLLAVTGPIGQAIAECRKSASLGPALAARTFWTVALAARRAGQ
jgi:DNA polymerase III subunit delta